MITIQELLYNRGLDRLEKIKIVRHKDKRLDLYNLYRTDKISFLDYQNTQSKDVFRGVDYIVSFIGEEGVLARFIGVFRIIGKKITGHGFKYEMSDVPGYDDLKERVIIRWENAISWHQWIKNEMEIVEICPGLHYKRFTDYFDLILTYSELEEIVENQYNDWKMVLSSIKGIYLITDINTGKLYVGSAYGESGIWGRWNDYISTSGHGNNKILRELMNTDVDYKFNLQFSILMILPKTVTPDEAILKEQLFKRKLGSNSFGLNAN